jgi:hypothetical protein
LGWRELSDHGIAFVASRWHTAIHRLPRMGEAVTLTTWHRERKGPRFLRCYEWHDSERRLLIEGVMQFALVSVTDHRLLRGDEFMALAPLPDATRGVNCADPGRFRPTEGCAAGTYTVPVKLQSSFGDIGFAGEYEVQVRIYTEEELPPEEPEDVPQE